MNWRQARSRTALIAEPDGALRSLVGRLLAAEGYRVLETGNGTKALKLAAQNRGPIDLLLTDSWLPGPHGRELCELVKGYHPGIRVLFISRSADPDLGSEVVFLKKPFSLQDLLNKVWDALDDSGRAERARVAQQNRGGLRLYGRPPAAKKCGSAGRNGNERSASV